MYTCIYQLYIVNFDARKIAYRIKTDYVCQVPYVVYWLKFSDFFVRW